MHVEAAQVVGRARTNLRAACVRCAGTRIVDARCVRRVAGSKSQMSAPHW